ncbi:hypothetical protein DOK_11846 [gamma proteobacterium BDW918]|nr:hypothetical protein DOK_11846 [gamma proteobacterium BDW918]
MNSPSYIDKLQARIQHRPIGVFIPRSPTTKALAHLKPGSAIVSDSTLLTGALIEVYYEGNIYGAENLMTFEEKALCATGRMIQRYPTTARSWVTSGSLIQVGHISVVQPMSAPVPESMAYLSPSIARRILPPHLADALDPKPEPICVIHDKYLPAFRVWTNSQSSQYLD